MRSKGTLNRVMIIGNLGADPVLRTLPDGGSVSNFSVATTDSWSNVQRERRDQTEWHRVTFFGRMAEILHEYGRKGTKLYIEGSLRTRKWTDKEGIERTTTEIRGQEFTFLSQPNWQNRGEGDTGAVKKPPQAEAEDAFGDMEEDDIPF